MSSSSSSIKSNSSGYRTPSPIVRRKINASEIKEIKPNQVKIGDIIEVTLGFPSQKYANLEGPYIGKVIKIFEPSEYDYCYNFKFKGNPDMTPSGYEYITIKKLPAMPALSNSIPSPSRKRRRGEKLKKKTKDKRQKRRKSIKRRRKSIKRRKN